MKKVEGIEGHLRNLPRESAVYNKKLNLDTVAFIGRTFDEYVRMLDLDIESLRGQRILDCPAGACSFAATANKRGIDIVAADTVYDQSPERLLEKCESDLEKVMAALPGVEDLYKWDYYGDPNGLREHRIRAYNTFIEDYRDNRWRYLRAELPELPFPDGSFSMVLSAHLLFLYGDRIDYEFHVKAINEFIRVSAGEVRIFPLIGLDAKKYPLLDDILSVIRRDGLKVEVIKVPFEFQKGADEALRIIKSRH